MANIILTEEETRRFWERTRWDPYTGCLEWTGTKWYYGYGKFQHGGRGWGAHRVAWCLVMGEIPDGLFILHSCDNTVCVNTDHLRPGTHADNMADMRIRGRNKKQGGEKNGNARLTKEQVAKVRARLAAGERQLRLAREFGISQQEISNIKNRVTWGQIAKEDW